MEIENTIVQSINKNVEESKHGIRLFHVCIIIFLVGEFFLIISTLNFATIINGVPRWFGYFNYVSYVAYLLFLFSTFFLRRLDKAFFYSFISMIIYILLNAVSRICETSTNALYVNLGKGLNWSSTAVICIFFDYFFYGCAMVFKKFGYDKGKRAAIIFLIVFTGVFLLSKGFEYFSTASFIRVTTFQRFFLYGTWIANFILYTLSLVSVLLGVRYLNKKIKEEKAYERKDKDVSK